MGDVLLDAARRRPYVVPAALAALCALAMFITASAEDLPIRDPDGVGGPPLFRLSAILIVFMLLDVVPRGLWHGRGRPLPALRAMRAVVRERWTGRRLALVLVGLFSFYATYVAYRNFKGFLPFLRPVRHDTGLLSLDRDLFFGQDPATLLHQLLGTGFANQALSVVYVIYLAFVPVSLAAALVWFGEIRHGLWYATALCLNWVLGAISYYLIPSMGPAFVAPQLFSDLAPTASSSLQHSLWVERLNVLWGPFGDQARDAVQSIAAFASLHVSVVLTAALVAHLLKANKWLVRALWLYLMLVMIATIYLGWHYVVDVPAGALIGVLSAALGAWATGHEFPLPGLRRRRAPTGSAAGARSGGAGAAVAAAMTRGGSGRRAATADGPPANVLAMAGPGGGRMAVAGAGGGSVALGGGPSRNPPGPSNWNLPNVLSALRIPMAPLVAALVIAHPDGSALAALVFSLAAITDIADGKIARSRGLVTSVGKLLDTTADKLLVVAALVSLVVVDRLALWIVAVIAGREVLVMVLRAHAARRGVVIAANGAGKAKMALQVAMVLVLMAVADPSALWIDLLVAVTVLLTIVSGLTYPWAYLRGDTKAAAPDAG